MANTDAAYGLRAIRHLTGGQVQTNVYTIASEYAANIFTGDPVELVAAGTIEIAAGGDVTSIGVFAGVKYVNDAGDQVFSKYWPTGTTATEIEAYVYDDPDIIFAIQADSDGAALADVGAQADWIITAGTASIGISKTVLDGSALSATAAGLRVLRIIDTDDNAAGAYADVEVVMSQHKYNTVGAGI